MTTAALRHDTGSDEGFSLIEMVVSMVLLALIAMAFLPLVTQATQAAASGSTLTTATRLVSDQMEQRRATPLTACPATSTDANGTLVSTMTALGGVELQTRTRYEGMCTDPGVVRYVVWVTRSNAPTVPVASSTTLVMVGNV